MKNWAVFACAVAALSVSSPGQTLKAGALNKYCHEDLGSAGDYISGYLDKL